MAAAVASETAVASPISAVAAAAHEEVGMIGEAEDAIVVSVVVAMIAPRVAAVALRVAAVAIGHIPIVAATQRLLRVTRVVVVVVAVRAVAQAALINPRLRKPITLRHHRKPNRNRLWVVRPLTVAEVVVVGYRA